MARNTHKPGARPGADTAVPLSPDDLQLLQLLASGLRLDLVARRLDVSDRTVRRRLRSICDQLGVGTSMEAVVWAARRQLL